MPEENETEENNTYPATVARVIDDDRVVINRGEEHGISEGQRFLIYELEDEEITDPETGEPIGHVEIVKGTGEVTHVQSSLATIESDQQESEESEIISTGVGGFGAFGPKKKKIQKNTYTEPFDNPKRGDKAKPI